MSCNPVALACRSNSRVHTTVVWLTPNFLLVPISIIDARYVLWDGNPEAHNPWYVELAAVTVDCLAHVWSAEDLAVVANAVTCSMLDLKSWIGKDYCYLPPVWQPSLFSNARGVLKASNAVGYRFLRCRFPHLWGWEGLLRLWPRERGR